MFICRYTSSCQTPFSFDDVMTQFAATYMLLKKWFFCHFCIPDLFLNLVVQVPRGVLFHGPPGTGKTAMARALAGTCNKSDREVAFSCAQVKQ
jgi:AAA+ superfamily predicted ATPase